MLVSYDVHTESPLQEFNKAFTNVICECKLSDHISLALYENKTSTYTLIEYKMPS